MPRLVRDKRLQTRSARGELKQSKKPYYRSLDPGLSIGYFKGSTGGTWIARRYLGNERYETLRLGIADDKSDADGTSVLSYANAIDAARTWRQQAASGHATPSFATYTVSAVLDDYIAHLRSKGSRSLKTTAGKINAAIRPTLGTAIVSKLSARDFADFQASLADQPVLSRSQRPVTRRTKPADEHEAIRARRATGNRTMSVLKAALNLAYREGRVDRDDAWRRTKPFSKTASARIRYLRHNEIASFSAALDGEFRPLAQAALVTGARYGELVSVIVSDVDVNSGTVLLRRTKNGKPRFCYLPNEGRALFEEAVAGKASQDAVFTRRDGRSWGASDQARPMRKACVDAGIEPPISFHDLRHTFASLLAQRGVPMRVIAEALGHADTRITEKHYAHLSPSYVATAVREGLPIMFQPHDRARICT